MWSRQRPDSGCHPVEDFIGIVTVPVAVTIHEMDLASFGKDAKVRVGQAARQLAQPLLTKLSQFRIAQQHKLPAEMFGQDMIGDTVPHQPPREIKLTHSRPPPIDDFRGEDAANLQLFTKSGTKEIDPRAIDFGQLGQIANPHHHLGVRMLLPCLVVPRE